MNARTQLRVLLVCWNCAFALHDSRASAAQPDAEVDKQEVLRLGDLVQHVGGGHQAPGEQEFCEAMGLPADDNHKWFVSVIGAKNCPHCGRLKKDLEDNEYLRALVNVADQKRSWAHFNWYAAEDKSQQWRWESIKLAGYPTILVQPPLNKKHGDPATVVMQQTGYDGDGRKLAHKITATIKAYLAKRAQAQAGPSPAAVGIRRLAPEEPPAKTGGYRQFTPAPGAEVNIGVDPPWTPVPKVEPAPTPPSVPAGPLAFPVDFIPTIPPAEVPAPKPQPKPTTPAPNKPAETPDAAEPEVLVITEGTAGASDARVGLLLSAVRDRHSGRLRERILDWRDAPATLNVRREDLPIVVVTDADGNVTERLGGRLLPLIEPPQTTPEVTIWDFPFAALLTMFTGGGTVAGGIAIAVWFFRWVRARRKAKETDATNTPATPQPAIPTPATPKPAVPLLSQDQFERVLAMIQQYGPLAVDWLKQQFAKPTTTTTPAK